MDKKRLAEGKRHVKDRRWQKAVREVSRMEDGGSV